MKKVFIIICEGNSELAYIQRVNRYLREIDSPYVFLAQVANGGDFQTVIKKYRGVRKGTRKGQKIFVWVDLDIYERIGRNKIHYQTRKDAVPEFLFSGMNFEDFLSLHNDDWLQVWHRICEESNHFNAPMTEKQYLRLWKENIIRKYQKGSLPDGFVIDREVLGTLFRNLDRDDIRFRCDFADLIKRATGLGR